MKNIWIDYPGIGLSFRLRKQLESDEQRTDHLQQYLKRNKIEIPNHDPEDMVVELTINASPNVEIWVVGS